MDALTNASALLDFLMEYKTTIKMLNSEKRVKLCNGILLVGIACDVIGMNIQSRYKMDRGVANIIKELLRLADSIYSANGVKLTTFNDRANAIIDKLGGGGTKHTA
jgi:hypothetical protein